MIGKRRAHLHVAPLGLRFAASLIDGVVAIGALGIGVGAFVVVAKQMHRRAPSAPAFAKVAGSARGKLALELCLFVLSVLLTGRRGPGSRIVGIRLVDVRTGRSPSRRQAILRIGARRVWQELASRSSTRLFKQHKLAQHSPEGLNDLRSEIEALKREHAGDQDALQQAIMRAYQERKQENTVRVSCLPMLIRLPLTAAIDAPALWSELHQGLPDMLAGTVVIVED